MQALLRVLLAAVLLIFLPSIGLADKRVALIVANGAYVGAPLENPIVDADLVAASLTNIGFVVTTVKNADLDGFDRAVTAFARNANGADIALFYFAGHGFAVTQGVRSVSVLMSTSADIASGSERVLRAGGIPLDDIVAALTGGAKATLIFVDACRNDPRVSRAIGGKGRGFTPLDPIQGGSLFIGLSTRLGDTAADGAAGNGSPFARAFAANIQARGVRIDDVFRRIRDVVRSETDGKQLPDIVQDDLPDGAITLMSSLGEPTLPGRRDDATPQPPVPPDRIDPRVREAAEIWATLRDSDDTEALSLFKSRYADTFYASLADLRIRKVEANAHSPSSVASLESDSAVTATESYGMKLVGLTDEARKNFKLQSNTRGIVVSAVEPNSPAAGKGLRAGDVIEEFNMQPVEKPSDVSKAIDALKKLGKKSVVMLVANGAGGRRFVVLGL